MRGTERRAPTLAGDRGANLGQRHSGIAVEHGDVDTNGFQFAPTHTGKTAGTMQVPFFWPISWFVSRAARSSQGRDWIFVHGVFWLNAPSVKL
jgi:hypothetical protein